MKRLLLVTLGLSLGLRGAADDCFWAALRPEERAAAGLANLTPAEREALQRLVEAYKAGVTPPTSAAPTSSATAEKTVVVSPGTKVEYAVIRSTVAGEFNGWKPGQVMTLANGQRWRVTDEDGYYIRRVENPEVEITPSKFGGYWMRFPALKARVRVELVGR